MNVIDALVVTLGLDPTAFKKGTAETDAALKKTRENTDKHTKEMEARAKATAAGFKRVTTEVAALLGVSLTIGGFKAFVERITNADAAVNRLAKNTGMATSAAKAWQQLSTKHGGSEEGMAGTMRTVAAMMSDVVTNGGNNLPLTALGRLFGSPADLAEYVRAAKDGSVEKMLRMLQRAVANAPNRASALSWFQQAGFSEETFTVMREIGDQLDVQLEKQQQMNAAAEKDGELAAKRQEAWSKLGDAMDRVGRLLTRNIDLTGALNKLANTTNKFVDDPAGYWAHEWDIFLKRIGIRKDDRKSIYQRASGKVTEEHGSATDEEFLRSLDAQAGLPEGTLAAMRNQESSGNDKAVSPKGAQGPFQFMPATWKSYGNGSPFDLKAAAQAAAAYMHDLMRQYGGDLRKALMAYNGGGRGAAGAYAESTNYANSILSAMGRNGGSTSKTEVSIGELHIHTNATDGAQTGRDFASWLNQNYGLASQANSGLY